MTASGYDIVVLGAGSYGTALAICIARNGHKVLLWGRCAERVEHMQQSRQNQQYLPDAEFPPSLTITSDLLDAVKQSNNLLVVVPSHAFADVLNEIKHDLAQNTRIAWATKGLEPETGRLLQDSAREIVGSDVELAVLSGPTFAKEMAKGMPTAISLSSTSDDFSQAISDLLHSDSFRVYRNQDFVGVQMGGAVKNVIAIGAGLADGIGFGANARTALITRGLHELCILGQAMGAEPATFMGMAGLGDLVLTCTDNQSRNRRFGLALGSGKSVKQAMTDIGQVVEGYRNTKEVYLLAKRCNVEMPITEQIYHVLYEGKPPQAAAMALLGREQKFE